MKTYTKADLIQRVSAKTGYAQARVAPMVDGMFQILRQVLAEANPDVRVEIRGFGTLGVKKAAAKPKARNPKTSKIIYVPPHRKTFFRPGRLLKQVLLKPIQPCLYPSE